jgi:molybdate transport system ATP-binding protein
MRARLLRGRRLTDLRPQPHHKVAVNARIGVLDLAVSFELTVPWTILFGPSGSGKSTVLRAACGLVPKAEAKFSRLASGAAGAKSAEPPRTAALVWQDLAQLPPHRRDLAYAPQQTALFPHLSVLDNVRFPYQVCNDPPEEPTLVDEALTLFHLHALAERFPGELSGGERRRVALARAFATPQARLMLLDEPFTGLDRALRDTLLPAMQKHLAARNVPVLSVTHDVDEALLLNAEVLRLDSGRIAAQGEAREVLAVERTALLKTLAEPS